MLAWFAFFVQRYFFLDDDCFISFRYAQNLVDGHGLVWNPGERVEGYTNFLWVLWSAFVLWVGGRPEVFAPALNIAAAVAILLMLAGLGASRRGWRDPWIWALPAVLAGHRSFAAWSSSGLATQFFSALVLAGMLAFRREQRWVVARPFGSALLFALAALTRPEGMLFAGVTGLFFLGAVLRRRRSWSSLFRWAAVLILLVGGHLLWRYSYYGHWLPNTFFAKVNRVYSSQGGVYLYLWLQDYRTQWFLPLVLVTLATCRELITWLFLSVSVLYLGYVVAVGGDWHEFRFLVVAMPWCFWLILAGPLQWMRRGAEVGVRGRGAAVGAVVAALLLVHYTGSVRPEAQQGRRRVGSLSGLGQYTARRVREGQFLRELIDEGLLPADLMISVGGAGALPYYSGLPTVDYLGLNDEYVAHLEDDRRGIVGHEKRAPWEYLTRRKVAMVDVLNRLVWPWNPGALPRTHELGYYEGPLRCVKVKDRALLFRTTLDDAEFRRVFGHLRILF